MFIEFFIVDGEQAALELELPHVPRKGELVLLEQGEDMLQYVVADVQWVLSANPEHGPFAQVFLDTLDEDEDE